MARLQRPRLVSAFALIVGCAMVAAFGIGQLATDSSKPSSKGDALKQFRKAVPHPVGYEGVYIYSTTGQESVSALGGSTHPYAPTTPITIVRTGCGLRVEWEPLDGRSTTWTLCTVKGNIELRGVAETHTFFKKTDHTNYKCTQLALKFTCTAGSGGESGDATPLGEALVSVNGEVNAGIIVRMTATVTGSSHGTETTEFYLAPRTLLPLRISITNRTSRHEPLVGNVHYKEDATLVLVSRTPSR
ncbi:MAG TPA: hypothetical protein VGH52_04775 [Gaiellaceae bacterium]